MRGMHACMRTCTHVRTYARTHARTQAHMHTIKVYLMYFFYLDYNYGWSYYKREVVSGEYIHGVYSLKLLPIVTNI